MADNNRSASIINHTGISINMIVIGQNVLQIPSILCNLKNWEYGMLLLMLCG